MVKKPTSGNDSVTPTEYAQVTPPRDLHSTSDIRFVMLEVGKLTANVERLINDITAHGSKIDELRHQATFIKGGLAFGIRILTAAIAIATFFLSSKWDAVVAAIKAAK